MMTCGSYRRGKEQCGDVDVLITRIDSRKITGMLERLVNQLEKQGFLKERLGMSYGNTNKAREMYMGVCKVEGEEAKARRIDIKVYPKECFGFAVLYFTGCGEFNINMRLHADEKGFTLSDHGMYPTGRAPKEYKRGVGI